jgi:hypothetical protein
MFEWFQWVVDSIRAIPIHMVNLLLQLLERIILTVLPASGPGIPGAGYIPDLGWMTQVFDFQAIQALVGLMVAGESVMFAAKGLRWLWGWVKW